ncbi:MULTISPECIES: hypothetical protein [unclassified Actinomyces]|uniref:hypothetical protein n=1 Tax=unclassified Actinomyces TaxID=2609248 RepID=UPI0020172B27|nr:MULTISPECIES: hypothetical protein [unclassified Actinomyces]MCL3777380.1 hypothetical protein [Actinomyces sp. AC-20-1]MCL3789098.1 hypothetical protein [Actinomyces sp. 187325]MCL3791672.1 hypothetical protein [Actinomyces sp. 186855]MCL3793900.1 hypothetical protein [Actinomyces sp. 217892]
MADASGLHVRGILTRRDLPWPASRGELVTVPVLGLRRTRTMAVQYRPADGSRAVTIHALARPTVTVLEDPDAVQEATDLWQWGVSRGYVNPAEEPRGAAEAPRAAGTATAGTALAPSDHLGLSTAGPGAVGSPLDPALHQAQALHLRAWDSARGALTVLLTVLGLILTAVIATLLSPGSAAEAVGAGVALLFFGPLTALVLVLASGTTTIDAEGFHVRRLGRLGRVDAPWPRSRSDLYVHVATSGRSGSTGTCVLLLPDGRPLMLPGTGGGRGAGGALRAWETSERIWAWGVSHGLARDDGAYRPCADRTWEARRRLSRAHLDVERARLSPRAGPAPAGGSDGTA